MMQRDEYVLEARDLAISFRLNRGLFQKAKLINAVAGVSFNLSRGETLGIVGESGCGKSTLAKLILGLETAERGEVFFNGQNVKAMSRLIFARNVQPIFQDPYSSLNPKRMIFDIVEQPLLVHGVPGVEERRKRVLETLALVGMPPRTYDSVPSQLSGGQRQRIAIARALVLRPDVIVCDEPTSALDVSIQAQILNLLKQIQEDYGVSYILISHNLAVVRHMANNVFVMYEGKIVESGPTEAIFKSPQQLYTKKLLASILLPKVTGALST